MNPPVCTTPARLAGQGPVVFALGTFDGLHLGHQEVLARTRQLAAELNALPAILFFDPAPKAFFAPETHATLMTRDAKIAMLRDVFGMRAIVQMPFNQNLAALTPPEFLRLYFWDAPGLATAGFVVGEDWRFGQGNCGDAALLSRLAAPHGARVISVPQKHAREGAAISSTWIRRLVAAGELDAAAQLLGRPFTLDGVVIHGQGLAASRLDCPTANLDPGALQLPPYGVYAARTRVEHQESTWDSIVYIGDAPTIRKAGAQPLVELHVLDFSGDLYGRNVCVEPVGFLRPSHSFPSPDALREQIRKDLARTRQILHP